MFDEIRSIGGFIIAAFVIIILFLIIVLVTDSVDSREVLQRVTASTP